MDEQHRVEITFRSSGRTNDELRALLVSEMERRDRQTRQRIRAVPQRKRSMAWLRKLLRLS